MADEILSKAEGNADGSVVTTTLGWLTGESAVDSGNGGILNAEQSSAFIDYMWDATTLAQEGRRIVMRANEVDIDSLAVGERVIRAAREADGTYTNAGVTFSKVTVSTKKVRLDWETSTEIGEDSIEAGVATHIAQQFAAQAGNDIEDLAINGLGSGVDDFLKILPGFKKLHADNAAAGRKVDWAAVAAANTLPTGVSRHVFDAALKAMPRKYRANRSGLRFYTGSGLVQDYLFSMTNIGETPEVIAADVLRGNISGPVGPGGRSYPLAFGVPIVEVPLFPETTTGTVELTFPQNRIWGIKREIEFYDQFVPKKDTTEYTMFLRFGVQIENYDAYVVVTGVDVETYPES